MKLGMKMPQAVFFCLRLLGPLYFYVNFKTFSMTVKNSPGIFIGVALNL